MVHDHLALALQLVIGLFVVRGTLTIEDLLDRELLLVLVADLEERLEAALVLGRLGWHRLAVVLCAIRLHAADGRCLEASDQSLAARTPEELVRVAPCLFDFGELDGLWTVLVFARGGMERACKVAVTLHFTLTNLVR